MRVAGSEGPRADLSGDLMFPRRQGEFVSLFAEAAKESATCAIGDPIGKDEGEGGIRIKGERRMREEPKGRGGRRGRREEGEIGFDLTTEGIEVAGVERGLPLEDRIEDIFHSDLDLQTFSVGVEAEEAGGAFDQEPEKAEVAAFGGGRGAALEIFGADDKQGMLAFFGRGREEAEEVVEKGEIVVAKFLKFLLGGGVTAFDLAFDGEEVIVKGVEAATA